ncbi:DUF1360 domain-containing protein [Micromonospora sp. 15K316]|uniref:DUF1360 domain-containing protein n=1 Tax=Micromonospora sp. 15K316 TaxID=2530376 RepID=UPI001044FF05|nr:DUF1360 domain-containing protein [Micromonospora sp. 15K316]TDC28496.1 DUF1360 domain-containing protein [Micromonospora sp. 15K316]
MSTLVVLIALGVASYRATHLVVHDSIADPVRDRLFNWYDRKPTSTPRDLLTTLISCTYCAGWWVSGAVLTTYLSATGGWSEVPLLVHGVEWFAVAGVQALLSRWNDTRAEQ